MLDKIFSIKNNISHKIITILGIKIKINLIKLNNKKIEKNKIKNNKIVFMNFNGKGYGCNPKYITEEIIRQNLPFEIVWLSNNKKREFPKQVKVVKYSIKNAIRELSTAKIWCLNHRPRELYKKGLFKKKTQYYIHTWHAWSLKKVEKDIENLKPDWCEWAKIDSKYIDLLLGACEDDKKVLERCFYYDGEILNIGLPRNDIFNFSNKEKNNIKNNLLNKLSIPKDKKIFLYAPTFRDDGRLDVFNLNIEKVLSVFEKKFDGDFVAMLRLHPNIKNNAGDLFKFSNKIIDVTDYPDIQELLLISDVMITDYSSCILDFILQRKPSFIFATDFEQYSRERDFNINPKEMPSPFADNNKDLYKQIENFDEKAYKNSLENFFNNYGCHPQKNVSKIIVSKIKENLVKNNSFYNHIFKETPQTLAITEREK